MKNQEFRPTRVQFFGGLAAIAGTAAVSGCGAKGSLLPFPQASLADLMKRTGVESVIYRGTIYYSDGSTATWTQNTPVTIGIASQRVVYEA